MTVVLGSGSTTSVGPLYLRRDFSLNPSMSSSALETAINDAVQSAISAGRPLSLGHEAWPIAGPLLIDGPLGFGGDGVFELAGSVTDTKFSCLLPTQEPHLTGALLLPEQGENAVNLRGAGYGAHLHDFGVRFDGAQRFTDTGHAIHALPTLVDTGYDNGLWSATLRRIPVYGHDGNHYAFDLTNIMMCSWYDLRAYGGGGFHVLNHSSNVGFDGFPINYGNLASHHIYSVLICEGTAHGVHLEATAGVLNLMLYNRPQVWAYDVSEYLPVTPPGPPQLLWKGGGANVRRVTHQQPDFEDNCGCGVEWTTLGASIDPAGNVTDPFAIHRPADFTFGNRSEARALWWNLDRRILIPTGTAEEWGDYDVASGKYVNSSEVGPGTGVSYTRRGTTGERPIGMSEGGHYYDTTLHKPIWWNGSAWKDGAGNTV